MNQSGLPATLLSVALLILLASEFQSARAGEVRQLTQAGEPRQIDPAEDVLQRTQPEEAWQFEREEDGISVFSRTDPESPFREFRCVMRIRSTLSAFMCLFFDFDSYPEWIHNSRRTEILERVSEDEIYAYTVTRTPWIMKDRDNILHTLFNQDPETLAITIRMKGVPDYRKKDRRYVRIPRFEGFWRFSPEGEGEVAVVYQARMDPGGEVPAFLSNWFVHFFPYHTLKKLREVIRRPEYQSVRLAKVKEPTGTLRMERLPTSRK